MKKMICLLCFSLCVLMVWAQAKKPVYNYTKATDLTMCGQLMPTAQPYQRIDSAHYQAMPPVVKRMFTHSAGKSISFITNSKTISAKWCVTNNKPYPNLTAIANKGLDLYERLNGTWEYAGVGRPTAQCTEAIVAATMRDGEKQFLLYMPIYDEVTSLEIGVDSGSYIKPAPSPFKKRVLVYGSSITQGASASRPGLAYPARLARLTGYDVLNLGTSGSAKMEPEVIAMLNDIQTDAYILDCIPNSTEQNIKDRTVNMINAIRAKHPGKPIILLNTIIREQGYTDAKVGSMVAAQNRVTDSIAHMLLQQKTPDFFYIDVSHFLGDDHEGSTDGIHPNDLGSYRFVTKLEPMVADILKKYFK